MKLEKKHWVIIGVVVAIILVWYFFLRKKKAESSYRAIRWCKYGEQNVGGKCVKKRTDAVSVYVNPWQVPVTTDTSVLAPVLTQTFAKTPTCPPGQTFQTWLPGCVPDSDLGLPPKPPTA